MTRFFTAAAGSDPGIVWSPLDQYDEEEGMELDDADNLDIQEKSNTENLIPSSRLANVDRRTVKRGNSYNEIKDVSYVRKIECGICKIKRPITASHCRDCGVCVEELDHHCPVSALL